MACSKEELEISAEGLCPICSDSYKAPRRLPTCGHTFCENCLFTFVFDLKEQGKIDATFDCPVCQQSQPFQSTREAVFERIKTFPLVPDPIDVNKGSCEVASETSDENRNCGLCAKVDVVTCGKKYCMECQTFICDGCVETHKKIKEIGNHKLFERSEVSACKNVLSELHKYRKCCSHPDCEVELYCRDDETFICLLCASTAHKNCRNVVHASECAEESQLMVEALKKRIIDTQKHLDKLKLLSRQNNTSVETQTDTVIREVTDIRNKTIDYLDSIIDNLNQGIKKIRQDEDDKESTIFEKVERLKASNDNSLSYLDSVNKYGKTPEVFHWCTQFEAEVEKLEDEVLILDSTLETSDVERPIVDVLNKISEELVPSRLPEIAIINKASDHQPKYTLPKSTSQFQVGKVEQHKIEFPNQDCPTFSGITVKDDGTLILSDSYHGYLGLYDPEQKQRQTLKMSKPYSSTMTNKQTVASTRKRGKQIDVVFLGLEMRINRSLDTKYQPMYITSLRDGKVAISWTAPPGFSIADISGSTIQESQYFTQDSDGRKFKSFDYLAINEPRKLVIQPCHVDKSVYCFDFTGKPIFKYTNDLKEPQGVAVDSKTGSVFVCDQSDACIHQLSASGQPLSVIRHTDLKHPLDVCYDKQRKCLWVTHGTGKWNIVFCFERA